MNIYKSCDTLPIYFFYKIMETSNYKFLIKEYNTDSDIQITEEKLVELQLIFKNIIYEYSKITNNKKIKIKYEKQIKIILLEFEYDFCVRVIELYHKHSLFEVLGLLEEYDYFIKGDKDVFKQLDIVNRKLVGLKNRIKILKINFTNKYKEDEEDEKVDVMSKLEEEAIYLQMNLDLKSFINTRETSVTTWFSMININKKKAAINGKINTKNKRSSRRG